MAISAELVDVVASVLGRPTTEVGNHLRNLRESGLVSVAGRGASAAQMTADDAVMLLLAIVGSERVKDSVATAQKLAALPVIKHRVNWRHKSLDPYQRRTLRPLLDLPQNHTLGDALRCLFGITVLCLGQDSGNSDAQASMRLFNKTPPAFRVRVNYPQYSAHIQVKFRSFAREYWTYGVPNSVLVADGAGASTGDLTQIREFSNVTVTKVCQVLGADK